MARGDFTICTHAIPLGQPCPQCPGGIAGRHAPAQRRAARKAPGRSPDHETAWDTAEPLPEPEPAGACRTCGNMAYWTAGRTAHVCAQSHWHLPGTASSRAADTVRIAERQRGQANARARLESPENRAWRYGVARHLSRLRDALVCETREHERRGRLPVQVRAGEQAWLSDMLEGYPEEALTAAKLSEFETAYLANPREQVKWQEQNKPDQEPEIDQEAKAEIESKYQEWIRRGRPGGKLRLWAVCTAREIRAIEAACALLNLDLRITEKVRQSKRKFKIRLTLTDLHRPLVQAALQRREPSEPVTDDWQDREY